MDMASGTAGLLGLAITVVGASHRYVSGVRHASRTVQAFFRGLSTLSDVLNKVDSAVHNPEIQALLRSQNPPFFLKKV
jgi:hypothetical protein